MYKLSKKGNDCKHRSNKICKHKDNLRPKRRIGNSIFYPSVCLYSACPSWDKNRLFVCVHGL